MKLERNILAKVYLLDTDTYSFLSQSHAQVVAHVSALADDEEGYICFATVGEWEYGFQCAKSPKAKAEIRTAGDQAFDFLNGVIQSSQEISNLYGEIRAALRRDGKMIPLNDIWIAAASLSIGATLVTHDGHFQHVKNLPIVDWTKP